MLISADMYSYLDSRVILFDRDHRHNIESIGQAQIELADLLSQAEKEVASDFVVLAHPGRSGFAWTGAIPSGLDGIEILNLKSVWERAWLKSKLSFAWSALVYPFHPQFALLRLYEDPDEELRLWDQLSLSRSVVGMVGSEATARAGPFGSDYVRFPSYHRTFTLASNHILLKSELTGEFEGDRKKILNALSTGRFYMSVDILGDPKGFGAQLKSGEKAWPMGSKTKFEPGQKLVVKIPRKPRVPFETKFLRNGQELMASNSLETEYQIHSPGVYRVIVRVFPTLTLPDGQRWMTWIYTNPFYIE
jgi:hypothetical protein